MLRLEEFRLRHPKSWEEARAMWSPDARYIAGGTDLLPNLKHRLARPKELVNLGLLPGGVHEEGDTLVLDAALRLQDLADHPLVRAHAAPLAQAAALVASPQIRTMGTLGGNVLLDTRCTYYNQSEFWRRSLGHCLKAEGSWCHVVGGPKTCVAAQSADTVPVLLAMDARLRLLDRELPLRDLYQYNGMDHLRLAPGELVTAVIVPRRAWRGSYTKLRTRDSIDFPQLGLAVCATMDGPVVQTLEVVVGAVSPQPKPLRGLDAFCGRALDAAAIDAIADLVYKQTRPQAAVHGDPAWRRQMAAVYTRRALAAL